MHLNFDGTNFLPDLTDETGGLTQNVGIVEIRSGQQKIAVNYRVPVFSDVEKDVVQPMTTIAKKYDLETKVFKIEDSVYMPKDSDLVQKMLSVYQDVTGELDAEPLAIGGGTFAKAMPNILAFGAEFNIAESTMHAYNESVKIDELKKMLLIYAEALTLLTKN
jgi:acetylornithine deacetylase/succinyl-diaminopimelate desuccinylase-like protein